MQRVSIYLYFAKWIAQFMLNKYYFWMNYLKKKNCIEWMRGWELRKNNSKFFFIFILVKNKPNVRSRQRLILWSEDWQFQYEINTQKAFNTRINMSCNLHGGGLLYVCIHVNQHENCHDTCPFLLTLTMNFWHFSTLDVSLLRTTYITRSQLWDYNNGNQQLNKQYYSSK